MKASVLGWVVAAVLGAAVALTGQRLLDAPRAPTAAPEAVVEAPPPPPSPADPAPARALAVEALAGAGVPHGAIRHGVYPLRGPGRQAAETLPLVAFTCPVDGGCGAVVTALGAAATASGLTLVPPTGGDRAGRPIFRALADGERPALALRAQHPGPRLTVIIGDVGREPALLDAVLALDEDVTLSVMANTPRAPEVAARLVESGREVLAHLPLEPTPPRAADGADFITTAMTPEAAAEATGRLLERVPGAVGVGVHLGGKLLASGPHVTAMLEVLGARGIFFVDRAQGASVAGPAARAQGVRAVGASHDLDADPNTPLAARLKAVEVALVLDGHAVVTARPDPNTLAALQPWLSTLRARRIQLLRASEIVR